MIKLAITEIVVIAIVLTLYYVPYYLIKKYLKKLNEITILSSFKYKNYDDDFLKYSECLSKNNFSISELEKKKFLIEQAIEGFERRYKEHVNDYNFLMTYLTIAITIAAMVVPIALTISNTDQELTILNHTSIIEEQASTIHEQASILLDQEHASIIYDQILAISIQASIIIDQAEAISDQDQGLVILDQDHAETISDKALEISNEALEMLSDSLIILKTAKQDNDPIIYDQASTIYDQASIINKQALAISVQDDNSQRNKIIANDMLKIVFIPFILIIIMIIKLVIRDLKFSKIKKLIAPQKLELLLIDKEIIRKEKSMN